MKKIVFILSTTILLSAIACKNDTEEENRSSTQTTTTQTTNTPTTQYNSEFYIDPSRLNVVKNQKDPELKKLYYQVYGTPSRLWIDGIHSSDASFKKHIENAEKTNKIPIVVIYGIPNRDCGSFSSGGHKDASSYKAWIDRLSAIIASRRAIVIIEPDAINYCGNKKGSPEYNQRAELLTYCAKTLKERNPNVKSYIHAGNGPLVTQNPEGVANSIIDGGLQYMRGFALNVSGLGGTQEEQTAAEKFVSYLATRGFKNIHYVIDTGRSGINRPKHQNAKPPYNSCNNFNAALGPRSTTKTSAPHADAYLWINGGGGSDGECNMGAPEAGQPYPAYTQALINNAIRVHSIQILEVPQELK